MAASSEPVYKKRTKNSAVLWRGSLSGARIWMLIINCLVCLRCASGLNCSGVDTAVATYPIGDINIEHGSPLEIYCSTVDDVHDLHFTVSGKQLQHTEIVNNTTIRLYIPNPVPHASTYYCTNTATRKHCTNNVLVDDKPQNVTDFSCVSNNLASLNCSWTSPSSISDIKYLVTFYMNNAKLNYCAVERISNTRYCIWSGNTMPRYRQNLATYVFYLYSWNVFGNTSQNFTVDHFSRVKPEKPASLKVLSKNPHNVTLQWQISTDLVDYLDCGVEHRIEYQIDKIDNQNVFHQVNTSLLPLKNNTYTFVLTDLPIAHMQYEVRIYIRSMKATSEDFWSDFNFIFFQTPGEIPHRPPNMPAGSFIITPYHQEKTRNIYVYWEQLEEFEKCGDNFTYEIQVSNVKEPLYPDKKKSLSFVMLSNITKGAIEVSVMSKNSNGTSVNSSLLYIPPETNMLEGPSSFTKLAYANGTYELSWVNKGLISVDNYTLIWCKYVYAQLCYGRIKYTVLRDPKKTRHVVNLPGDERYTFAISVNQGTYTSGLVWAKCDISKDAANYDIPVHLENSIPIGSSVMITWTMDCTLQDGIVTGYNLTYCPINETSNLCDDNVKNDPIHISDPKSNKINVTDLLYHRIYKFDFVLLTVDGPIPKKDSSINVLIPEGTPSHPLNIKISDITHDSLVISYDPPEKRNGNIVVYVIYNNDTVFYNDTAELPNAIDTSRRYTRLTNLIGFTNYTLNVQACNKHCSELRPLDAISVRTSIGPPVRLRPPTIKYSGDGVQRLEWAPLKKTAGLVVMYQVKRVKDGEEDRVFNMTANFLNIQSHFCDGVSTYYLRAVNFESDLHHGAATQNTDKVILPQRRQNDIRNEYLGDWSDPPTTVDCRSTLAKTIMYLAIFILFIATVIGFIKLYRIYMVRKDIEPWLPEGLQPHQELKKYAFNEQPSRKDDKPEEKSLLYGIKTSVPTPEVKQKDEFSGTSDHTASTVISDISREPVDMEASTSDEGSDCSLDTKLIKNGGKRHDNAPSGTQQPEKSAPFGDMSFKKNSNGYVQTVPNPPKESALDNIIPFKVLPPKELSQPTTSSYVVASLEPPTFTSVVPSFAPPRPAQSSGYISHSDIQPKSFMNFPMLGSSPTKPLVPEAMPVTPPITKYDADSFPLQTLDALWGLSRGGPAKACSPGYVSPEEAVRSKHLSLLADSRLGGEDPAILEPAIMSPDAYCRFSWNVNPANDNLNSLHAEPSATDSSKN